MSKEYSSLESLWGVICEIVRSSQQPDGSTLNPVVRATYYREAAFSANILATNALRYGFKEDAALAHQNIKLLWSKINNDGVVFDEPIWAPRGENIRPGSLPATVYLFEALNNACKKLETQSPIHTSKTELLDYIESCEIKPGIFAHDRIEKNAPRLPHPVINTSLMAVWLKQLLGGDVHLSFFRDLKKQQRSCGLWPYLYSSFFLERALDKIQRVVPKSRTLIYVCQKLLKDRSFFFSDFHHHAVCLQYLLKIKFQRTAINKRIVSKAWAFIENNLKHEDGSISLNFDWEPQPNVPRYSNFKDTTTYFVVIEILYLLYEQGTLSKKQALTLSNSLSAHILKNLVASELHDPSIKCILPYEGTKDQIDLIFPRPAESVFHKGHLMCNMINLINH